MKIAREIAEAIGTIQCHGETPDIDMLERIIVERLESMTAKARQFDAIRDWLWERVRANNLSVATVAAVVIRQLDIHGPEGEEPDEA